MLEANIEKIRNTTKRAESRISLGFVPHNTFVFLMVAIYENY